LPGWLEGAFAASRLRTRKRRCSHKRCCRCGCARRSVRARPLSTLRTREKTCLSRRLPWPCLLPWRLEWSRWCHPQSTRRTHRRACSHSTPPRSRVPRCSRFRKRQLFLQSLRTPRTRPILAGPGSNIRSSPSRSSQDSSRLECPTSPHSIRCQGQGCRPCTPPLPRTASR